MEVNRIMQGDCLGRLKDLPDNSIDLCVTSPPYFGLRSYLPADHPDKVLEIGAEMSVGEFIAKLVEVFREVRRVLKPTGSCFLNIGDKYNSGSSGGLGGSTLGGGQDNQAASIRGGSKMSRAFKPKDMMLIPERLKIALQDDGWWVRDTIIWVKGREYADCDIGLNPMPGSQKDRCTPAYESLIHLTKAGKGYYFDWMAIAEPPRDSSIKRVADGPPVFGGTKGGSHGAEARMKSGKPYDPYKGSQFNTGKTAEHQLGRASDKERERHQLVMPRNVWPIPAKGFKEAHFATFPPELASRCIRVGSSEYGCCASCGSPYVRTSDKRLVAGPKAVKTAVQDVRDDGENMAADQGSNRQRDGHMNGYRLEMETTGWAPTCKCGTTLIIPALILDPFFGAGTSGLVAQRLGRSWLGVELNAEYIDMALKRIAAG